ncbi:hypothetical protein C0991_011432 [Blastosporella zonata]|nr:hypothetical protein C0991_011432 [Blastosporella zonata]
MDVFFSIVTGLGLRLFFDGLDEYLGRLGPVLLGLWEGVIMHHLSVRNSLDHSLAYTLRIAVDIYFTANIRRAEYITPTTRPPRRLHRRRISRPSVLSPIRHYAPEPLMVSSTPIVHPSRPPTPPSFFLEGESESYSGYPSRTFAEGDEEHFNSPSPKPILPPTPPSTLPSEVRDPRIIDRLSTIEEHSSGEEGSRRSFLEAVPGAFTTRNVPSYQPSAGTTPLPVPNSTFHSIHTSISQAASPAVQSSPPRVEIPPLPVPNMTTKYYTSEDEGDDPLQTPPAAGSAPWELVLTDDNDGLTTPPAHELSPLVLERNLLPSFGQVSNVATTEAAAAQLVPSAVECPATLPHRDPDPTADPASPKPSPDELEPEPDPELEPASSYPTPIPSPTIERDQQAQQRPHDTAPTGTGVEDAGQETETETDATSVISSHPANVMWLRAEALRKEARAAEDKHALLQKELKLLQNVPKRPLTAKKMLFLKHRMREEGERAKKLHEKAAKRFFEARNALRKRQQYTVDVHGLRVAEAVAQTEQALRDAINARAPSVRVIVGKGLHSAGNIPILKGAIIKIMEGYGIPCKVDPGNTGVLIMTLGNVQ